MDEPVAEIVPDGPPKPVFLDSTNLRQTQEFPLQRDVAAAFRPCRKSRRPRHCLFLSSQSIGSHSSTLLPSGSRIQANLPFSADSGPFTGSIPFAFSCARMPSSESTR